MTKQIRKAYRVRLYPNDEQQIFLAKSFGCTRFIWNKMLADKISHYQETNTELEQLDNPKPKQQHIPQNFTEDKGDW